LNEEGAVFAGNENDIEPMSTSSTGSQFGDLNLASPHNPAGSDWSAFFDLNFSDALNSPLVSPPDVQRHPDSLTEGLESHISFGHGHDNNVLFDLPLDETTPVDRQFLNPLPGVTPTGFWSSRTNVSLNVL